MERVESRRLCRVGGEDDQVTRADDRRCHDRPGFGASSGKASHCWTRSRTDVSVASENSVISSALTCASSHYLSSNLSPCLSGTTCCRWTISSVACETADRIQALDDSLECAAWVDGCASRVHVALHRQAKEQPAPFRTDGAEHRARSPLASHEVLRPACTGSMLTGAGLPSVSEFGWRDTSQQRSVSATAQHAGMRSTVRDNAPWAGETRNRARRGRKKLWYLITN